MNQPEVWQIRYTGEVNKKDDAASVKMQQVAAKGKVRKAGANTVLSEVKIYSTTLSYTNQLKDFVAYSVDNGLEMHLYTDANLSGSLQQMVDSGIIQVFPLK